MTDDEIATRFDGSEAAVEKLTHGWPETAIARLATTVLPHTDIHTRRELMWVVRLKSLTTFDIEAIIKSLTAAARDGMDPTYRICSVTLSWSKYEGMDRLL